MFAVEHNEFWEAFWVMQNAILDEQEEAGLPQIVMFDADVWNHPFTADTTDEDVVMKTTIINDPETLPDEQKKLAYQFIDKAKEQARNFKYNGAMPCYMRNWSKQ